MFSVVAFDGQVYGPADIRTLIGWCHQGRIVANTHLVETQTGRTLLAADLPDLAAALAQAQSANPHAHQGSTGYASPTHAPAPHNPYAQPNPYAPNPYASPNPYGAQYGSQLPSGQAGYGMPKSRSTALWLCFLLGPLGAHRFYLGHTKSAIAMLVVGLLSLINCPCAVAICIWCTIDFIRVASGEMTDAQGVRPR